MKTSPIYAALEALAQTLQKEEIPYAIIGALALNESGYQRATQNIDVLLTSEGLQTFKKRHLGREYVEKFPGSKGLRDTRYGVPIDVILAGKFPGDGKPKPVVFPDPALVANVAPRLWRIHQFVCSCRVRALVARRPGWRGRRVIRSCRGPRLAVCSPWGHFC